MFNIVTESLIKRIPHIDGINEKRLPQFLSKTYARIISLRTKYEMGEIPFNNEELKDDYRQLNIISNTLELFLLGNHEVRNRKSVAYVAAITRKLMSMIPSESEKAQISLHYLPEDLYATLLFIISGNFADALEVADNFDFNKIDNNWAKLLYLSIQQLAKGHLLKTKDHQVRQPKIKDNAFEVIESLILCELIKGVQHLANHLMTSADYDNEEFQRVMTLSVFDLEMYGQKDVYTGTYILAMLLKEAASELIAHALVHIPTPNSLDEEVWRRVIKKQAGVRPYLWDNHLEGIQRGMLNPGISSIITFPTGAGKTTLSELKIISILQTGKRVIYLVPTHALEHQVNRNISRLINRIEPMTFNIDGEFSIFDDEEEHSVMVMTPEHCLTLIKVSPEKLKGVGLVVFDEFHLISGNEGNNRAIDSMLLLMELLYLIPEADYCFISAMVKNGNEIADWIQGITKRPCILLDNAWKPTSQLQGCVLYDNKQLQELEAIVRNEHINNPQKKGPWAALNGRMLIQPKCLFSLKTIWDSMNLADYYLADILNYPIYLKATVNSFGRWGVSANYNVVAAELATKFASIGLKIIVFALTPQNTNKICKDLIKLIGIDKSDFLISKCKKEIDNISMELGEWEYSYLSCCISATLHHSLLLPEERALSERYFKDSNGVSVMIATPTIAQGINLPADIVLIAGSTRFDSQSSRMEQIQAHEILNAAGRAGRAGFRSHGTAILIPSNPIGIENNEIGAVWLKLKDEIFSKGDRCLEISDPFETLLNGNIQVLNSPVLNRIKGDRKEVRAKLSNSFYAYKMRCNGEQKQLDKLLEQLVELASNQDENMSWLSVLSMKTGLNEDSINKLYELIDDEHAMSLAGHTTQKILHWIKELLSENPDLMKSLLYNDLAEEKAKVVVGLNVANDWNQESIEKLFKLVEMYVNGEPLVNIELEITGAKKTYLEKARNFVLRVIPSISYLCGTFVQILLVKLENHGVEDIPNDVKTFASCVKEGVINYDMLMTKYHNKWMRVECHNKFKF